MLPLSELSSKRSTCLYLLSHSLVSILSHAALTDERRTPSPPWFVSTMPSPANNVQQMEALAQTSQTCVWVVLESCVEALSAGSDSPVSDPVQDQHTQMSPKRLYVSEYSIRGAESSIQLHAKAWKRCQVLHKRGGFKKILQLLRTWVKLSSLTVHSEATGGSYSNYVIKLYLLTLLTHYLLFKIKRFQVCTSWLNEGWLLS